MKRYKDCTLVCKANQTPRQLMDIIYQVSLDKNYTAKIQPSSSNKETMIVYLNYGDFPHSRMVLGVMSDGKGVSVLNIVPMPESGVSHIDLEVYNEMLDVYTKDVFETIRVEYGNEIEGNNEEYTIQEIIPKSFEKLDRWLNNYPLSSHQLDTNRWYDFVISLHQNEEHISLEDMGKYLKDTYSWSEEDVLKIQLRLESHLELLAYYERNR